MHLRPQDVLVSLRLAIGGRETYPELARALHMSLSEVHASVRRSTEAGLLGPDRQANREALFEFITRGVRYAFPPVRGGLTRGIPTAHGAPPLKGALRMEGDPVPVWPDPHGEVRG